MSADLSIPAGALPAKDGAVAAPVVAAPPSPAAAPEVTAPHAARPGLENARPVKPAVELGSHIPVLDGIRGLAVLLVIAHHFGMGLSEDYPRLLGRVFFQIVSMGWVGVDLFFVLSGFLITGILLDAKGSAHFFRNFYVRRVLRIFPLYYGVLVMVFVALPLAGVVHVMEPAQQIWAWLYGVNCYGFAQSNWHTTVYYGVANTFKLGSLQSALGFGHFWSLAVEEHFYMAWPLLVWLCSRQAVLRLCVGMIVGALACRIALVALGCNGEGLPYQFTPCRVDALAVGAFLAAMARGPKGLAVLLQPARWMLLSTGVALAALFLCTYMKRPDNPWVPTLGYSLMALFFGATLTLCVDRGLAGRAPRWLDNGFMRFFGRYSYGMYVYQGLFWGLLTDYCLPVGTLNAWTGHYMTSVLVHFIAATAAIVLIALVSWHLYEKQFLKLKKYFEYRAA